MSPRTKNGRHTKPARHSAATRRVVLSHQDIRTAEKVIPMKKLKDGQWYRGIGRNSSFGRWDENARCFWVVVFNDFPDPARYPEGSTRQVRLKQEDYFTPAAGSFKPLLPL